MGALADLSSDLASAVSRTAPSLVTVHARRRLPSTGVVWKSGLVVTADHTVRIEEGITVVDADGRSLSAKLAGRDPGTDLAVLTVPELTAAASLAEGGDLEVGHLVLAIGFGPRASLGVVSTVGPRWRSWRGGEIDRLLRLDLTLYPGFSGGPLVDASARVAGIVTSGLARDSRLALPVSTVTRVADELARTGRIARGYLGLGMQPVRLPDAIRASLGLAQESALIVVTVEPDGPAARAGVLLGDVLVSLDGHPLRDLDDVQARLGGGRIGQAIPVVLVRAGARTDVSITVGEAPRRG